MEESTRLTDRPNRNPDFRDDECSTDSGCGSGGSTGSAERLSRRGSGERLCGRSPRTHHYLDRLRGRSIATRSQDRLSRSSKDHSRAKSSRSWSPSDFRPRPSGESPSHFHSPSDAHSSDSDSFKRPSASLTLRKAFQSLTLLNKEKSEKKRHKKSPKRILRSPVAYTYVRGLSGLPTQRVPRNVARTTMPCTCQDSFGLYR
ncbi:uncharacterized protein LOC117169679 [Belonocnema kinseyi]|uniref:uncharacterized protein LOC117169679 n=1 Tax=Belonocnema kinseyi TaxID=2817044 RepID=UPI00143D9278|nr:uncharacterized protein LOC117169679 [Belonocnema kinseyi]